MDAELEESESSVVDGAGVGPEEEAVEGEVLFCTLAFKPFSFFASVESCNFF
jgi:hypothetical protein